MIVTKAEEQLPLTDEQLAALRLEEPILLTPDDMPQPAPPPPPPTVAELAASVAVDPAIEARLRLLIAESIDREIARIVAAPRVAKTVIVDKQIVRGPDNRIARVIETHRVEE